MISVVISTRKTDDAYLKRIKETAGTEVEILCYENNNQYSLTEIYNRGLKESQNEVVVFMHDDLLFEKEAKWGIKLYEALMTTDYGILGKAGTTHMMETAKWWEDHMTMVGRVWHQQLHPKTGKLVKWPSEYSGYFTNRITPVVAVDGLIFAVHKGRIKASFDESIKGFHLYEIDFCLANFLEGVKIGVVFNFDVTHKSIGQTNQEWENNRQQVAKKYEGKLPLKTDPVLFVDKKEVKIKKQPFVSVIVPTKGKMELVSNLIGSINANVSYENYEVIIADTGSTPEEKKDLQSIIAYADSAYAGMGEWKSQVKVRMVEYDYYNFAKINNDVVNNHLNPKTELIVFCNNDIVFQNDCISLMVDTYLKHRHTCGTIGARLHFPDNQIQHAGIFVSRDKDKKLQVGHIGYKTGYQYHNKTYNVIGSTAALLMVSKTIFDKVGGFNEAYIQCFEDVELNLELAKRRCKNYICGEAVALHYESQSREPHVIPEDMNQLSQYVDANYDKLVNYLTEL
jgi:GT2 family glycosyltransferase